MMKKELRIMNHQVKEKISEGEISDTNFWEIHNT